MGNPHPIVQPMNIAYHDPEIGESVAVVGLHCFDEVPPHRYWYGAVVVS